MTLVFLMKIVGAIKTIDEMNDLLLTDELLMSMCGFNAYQVKNGNCQRGVKLRKTHNPEITIGYLSPQIYLHNPALLYLAW